MITGTRQYITFRLAKEEYAVNVAQVREVLEVPSITRVPGSPPYVRGVVNVRGQAIPVFDLRLRFGLPEVETSLQSRILVMEVVVDGELKVLGGIADSVHEVIDIEADDMIEPPKLASRGISDCIQGMARRGEGFIIILDANAILFANACVGV